MSSQAALDRKMYLAVQCVRMREDLLHELVAGPNPEWHEAARNELERRASPVVRSVTGDRLSPNG
jgi:hypothetical protein